MLLLDMSSNKTPAFNAENFRQVAKYLRCKNLKAEGKKHPFSGPGTFDERFYEAVCDEMNPGNTVSLLFSLIEVSVALGKENRDRAAQKSGLIVRYCDSVEQGKKHIDWYYNTLVARQEEFMQAVLGGRLLSAGFINNYSQEYISLVDSQNYRSSIITDVICVDTHIDEDVSYTLRLTHPDKPDQCTDYLVSNFLFNKHFTFILD